MEKPLLLLEPLPELLSVPLLLSEGMSAPMPWPPTVMRGNSLERVMRTCWACSRMCCAAMRRSRLLASAVWMSCWSSGSWKTADHCWSAMEDLGSELTSALSGPRKAGGAGTLGRVYLGPTLQPASARVAVRARRVLECVLRISRGLLLCAERRARAGHQRRRRGGRGRVGRC